MILIKAIYVRVRGLFIAKSQSCPRDMIEGGFSGDMIFGYICLTECLRKSVSKHFKCEKIVHSEVGKRKYQVDQNSLLQEQGGSTKPGRIRTGP